MGVSQLGGTPAKVNTQGDAVVSLTNPSALALGMYAGLSGWGAQRVTIDPATVFSDMFDGSIDLVHRWANTGSTVVPTVTGGEASVAAGLTASASSVLQSIPMFDPEGATFQGLGLMNRFENAGATAGLPGYINSHRFFGLGTVAGTWVSAYTASATTGPLLNGYGFEVDTDGHLYAVVYANGVRTRPDAIGQTAGEKRLTLGRTIFNGETHQFTLVMRPDAVFWYIDGQDTPAAVLNYRSAGFPIPTMQTLPIRIHEKNSTTAPTQNSGHKPAAVALADTGRNALALADGAMPWRRAGVVDPATITGATVQGAREMSVGSALNVNTNALQLPTYKFTARMASTALTANTLHPRIQVWKSNTSAQTMRIRRIEVSCQVTAVAQALWAEVHRITASNSVGQNLVAYGGMTTNASHYGLDLRNPGPVTGIELSHGAMTSLSSVGLLMAGFVCASNSAALHGGGSMIYDFESGSNMQPLVLRAGTAEGIFIGLQSNAAPSVTSIIEVTYTLE